MRRPRLFALAAACLALAAILAPSPARARIGETLAQCTARYGEPVKTLENRKVIFEKGGFQIGVTFFDGKVDTIAFKKPTDSFGNLSLLSDNELATLREANGGGQLWKMTDEDGGPRRWLTEDKRLIATYSAIYPELTITTKDALDRAAAKARETEKNNLRGF